MKPKAIICDIDGCLLNVVPLFEELHKRNLKGDEKWDCFHEYCNNEQYVSKVKQVFDLCNMYNDAGYHIILLTGRLEKVSKQTLHYLLEGDIKLNNINRLICKPDNFYGKVPTHEYKQMELNLILKEFDVQFAIDDEYNNCTMYERNNIVTLRLMNFRY